MKKPMCAILLFVIFIMLSSCTMVNMSDEQEDSTSAVSNNLETASKTADGYDFEFTDRDKDSSYEQSACKLVFSDSSVKADSSNSVVVDGANVTVTSEGTYILSGSSSDGSITIDAGENDKIQLVFDNLSLTSSQAPLVIKEADKVFITLADNSENRLSDSSSYSLTIDDSSVDAAIFSKADLTLNGGGSLEVNGNYKHAIVSKDDLVITGGSISVISRSTGIEGKDCVKITEAVINAESGSDCIRSTNTEETDTRGFVYIKSGSFNLNAGNDALQAASVLQIEEGEFNITTGGGSENGQVHTDYMGMDMFGSNSDSEDTESAKTIKAAGDIIINGGAYTIDACDDAVHSNSNIEVSSGDFSVKTGDDGIHANGTLTINEANINITESYEGIEAGDIVVNGGSIYVKSSDDAFNASGGSDGEIEEGAFSSSSNKSLTINGGYIVADAGGDGLDSNGSILITGGVTLVSGPENDGNGALDYDTTATIEGGTLLALGSSGMAQSVTGSNQCTIMTDITSQNSNTLCSLCDSDGNVIVSFMSPKRYSNIVASTPELQTGETYKIICSGSISGADEYGYASGSAVSEGNEVAEITLTEENYSSGSHMLGGMGENPNGGFRGR